MITFASLSPSDVVMLREKLARTEPRKRMNDQRRADILAGRAMAASYGELYAALGAPDPNDEVDRRIEAGTVTVNEVRAHVGLPPVAGGDVPPDEPTGTWRSRPPML